MIDRFNSMPIEIDFSAAARRRTNGVRLERVRNEPGSAQQPLLALLARASGQARIEWQMSAAFSPMLKLD